MCTTARAKLILRDLLLVNDHLTGITLDPHTIWYRRPLFFFLFI